MPTSLLKKDYTIIGTSTKNPQRIIIEVDKRMFENLTSRKRWYQEDISLRDYISSGAINNASNISRDFESVDELISSMK